MKSLFKTKSNELSAKPARRDQPGIIALRQRSAAQAVAAYEK